MSILKVFSPVGNNHINHTKITKRLDFLDGKTIGEVWNGVFKGEITFPIIRKLLKQKYPNIKIIPYTEFPHNSGSDNPSQQRELAQRIALMAKEKGCDAIISGNGA
jgi:hypothetical protein